MNTFDYWAFISYSHQDRKRADWLHRSIERYRIPRRLVGTEGRDVPVPARLYPVFRDREELPCAADLPNNIKIALERSRFIIVICSPHSAKSRWVNEEVRTFKAMNRADRVLAVIVDGEPNASDKPELHAEECFPETLRYHVDCEGNLTDQQVEPIAADVRPGRDGKRNAYLKLVAGVTGLDYAALKDRERSRRRRRLAVFCTATVLILAVMVGLALYAFHQSYIADLQRKVADQRLYIRSLSEAQQHLAKQEWGLAEKLLFQAPIAMRNWEWGHLLLKVNPAIVSLNGHTGPITAMALSPDGLFLATASEDATARVWEMQTGAEIAIIRGHGGPVYGVAFSPDGKRMATVSLDSTARVWDAKTGAQLAILHSDLKKPGTAPSLAQKGFSSSEQWASYSIAFSPDGKLIGITFLDSNGYLWTGDTSTAGLMLPHGKPVNSVEFSPDSRTVVTSSDDAIARVWDSKTGTELVSLQHDKEVSSAAFSPDGSRIVTGSADGTLRMWSTDSGNQLQMVKNTDRVEHAAFTPDGFRVIAASADHKLRVYSADLEKELSSFTRDGLKAIICTPDAQRIFTLNGVNRVERTPLSDEKPLELSLLGTVNALAISVDGAFLIAGYPDGTVRLFDAEMGPFQQSILSQHIETAPSLSISSDGRRILCVPEENKAEAAVRDMQTGEIVAVIKTGEKAIVAAMLNVDGQRALTVSGRELKIWDAGTGTQLGLFKRDVGEMDGLLWASFSPDNNRVVSAFLWGNSGLWDTYTGQQLVDLSIGGEGDYAVAAAFSPNSQRVAIVSENSLVRLYDAANGNEIIRLQERKERSREYHATFTSPMPLLRQHSGHGGVAFGHNGRNLVVGLNNGTVMVCDAETGVQSAVLLGHNEKVTSVAFSADDRRILTVAADKTARLWDADSRVEVALLQGSTEGITSAAFSPDGSRIVSTINGRGRFWIWDAYTGTPLYNPASAASPETDIILWPQFTPDGRYILTSGWNDKAFLWIAAPWRADQLPRAKMPLPDWEDESRLGFSLWKKQQYDEDRHECKYPTR